MATLFGRYACFLGLYDSKGFAIPTIQNIVAESNALGIRHTFDFDLNSGFSGNGNILSVENIPSGFFEVKVDIELSCVCLAHIRRFLILSTSAFFLSFDQSDKICKVIVCKLVGSFLDLLIMLGIHTKDTDIMEGVNYITILDIVSQHITIYKLEKGCLFGLVRVCAFVDIVNGIS